MRRDEWWKNFALGAELDVAGTFIYNGIKTLHDLDCLDHAVEIFEVLYNLSVGIERLLKVAVILIEHDDQVDIEQFEGSLLTHSTIELANRVQEHVDLGITDLHREWLSLLSKFYKTYRYGRYTFRAVPSVFEEKRVFQEFLAKHLRVELGDDEWFSLRNTDQIRRFVGKVVKRITDSLFKVVRRRAGELNIYTDELRGDSKAIKTFYGKRLDFIDETIKKKELLLFLMSEKAAGDHLRLLKSIDALDLDPPMVPGCIKALLNDLHLHHVGGVVDELYLDVKDKAERFAVLGLMEDEHVAYASDGEDNDAESDEEA
jgi:hypothetical protein